MKEAPSLLTRIAETALQTLYPPACIRCEAPLFGNDPAVLCNTCYEEIEFLGDGACRFCGSGAGEFAELGKGCARCREHALRFTRATGVAAYGPSIAPIVHDLKFHGKRRLASPLGRMMAKRVGASGFPKDFDAVIPVPLHKKRLRTRGYNQAELLSRILASKLEIPLRTDILKRIRHTEAQATLTYAKRVTNPVGAFAAEGDLGGRPVLLVDDVLTTGTTVSECAGALRAINASRVYVIVFAR